LHRRLKKNAFNGTLSLGDTVGPELQLVDLQDNDISSVTLSSGYTNTLMYIASFFLNVLQTVYINLLKKLSLVADSKEILYAQQLSPTQTTVRFSSNKSNEYTRPVLLTVEESLVH